MAWEDFKSHSDKYSHEDVLKYVPKKDRKTWHEKMMLVANKGRLRGFMEICSETKEWELLAKRVLKTKEEELEGLSHYSSEKPAKALEKKHPLASAKRYLAMANRGVNAGKSKYYGESIENFEMARKLYLKEGKERTWTKMAKEVESKHSRKYSFIGDFKSMAEGKPKAKTIDEKRNDMLLNDSKKKFLKKD
jgi:hypothetical protein